ncbi:MAG: tetratricopeptide repeat protein [bacterium]|jgi:predicted Zn-dependent protease|nr:tetratricopeptide repeat protein [bacterium]
MADPTETGQTPPDQHRHAQANALRQELVQTQLLNEIRRRVRESLRSAAADDLYSRLAALAQKYDFPTLKSELTELKRKLEIDQIENRISIKTYHLGTAMLAIAAEIIDRPHPTPLYLETTVPKFLGVLKAYCQQRGKETAEETTLRQSAEFYLRFVEAAKRAQIETVIERRLKSMPWHQRIRAIKMFIEILVKSSPRIKAAEVDRLRDFATHLMQQGDPDNAIVELNKAQEYAPADAHLFQLLGQAYGQAGNSQRQLANYQRSLQLKPQNPELHLTLAQLYESQSQWPAALTHYNAALRIQPLSKTIRNHTAKLAFDTQNWAIALPLLAQMVEEQPRAGKPLRRLAIALLSTDQAERAVAFLKKRIRMMPDDAEAHQILGQAYRQQKYYSEAFSAIHQAVRLNPGSLAIQLDLVQAYLDRGEEDEAKRLCLALLDQFADYRKEIAPLYSETLRQMAKPSEALAFLRPLLKQGHANDAILLEYALAAQEAGKTDEAYTLLHALLKKNPQAPSVREAYIQTCILSGKFAEAASLVQSSKSNEANKR